MEKYWHLDYISQNNSFWGNIGRLLTMKKNSDNSINSIIYTFEGL